MPAFTIDMELETCCNCGLTFAMPSTMMTIRRDDGKSFYCPNGHPQHYSRSTQQNLNEALAALEEKARALTQAKCDAASERARREKAEQNIKKQRCRVGNGVCPCCNRSFTNLRRHMKAKHPSFK